MFIKCEQPKYILSSSFRLKMTVDSNVNQICSHMNQSIVSFGLKNGDDIPNRMFHMVCKYHSIQKRNMKTGTILPSYNSEESNLTEWVACILQIQRPENIFITGTLPTDSGSTHCLGLTPLGEVANISPTQSRLLTIQVEQSFVCGGDKVITPPVTVG